LFLRCAGPRLLPSTGLVTFTLVTLLSRYIRTNTDSSKLSIDRPARSGRAMHVPCASATSGQQRSVPCRRWTTRQRNVSAAHGAGTPTDL